MTRRPDSWLKATEDLIADLTGERGQITATWTKHVAKFEEAKAVVDGKLSAIDVQITALRTAIEGVRAAIPEAKPARLSGSPTRDWACAWAKGRGPFKAADIMEAAEKAGIGKRGAEHLLYRDKAFERVKFGTYQLVSAKASKPEPLAPLEFGLIVGAIKTWATEHDGQLLLRPFYDHLQEIGLVRGDIQASAAVSAALGQIKVGFTRKSPGLVDFHQIDGVALASDRDEQAS